MADTVVHAAPTTTILAVPVGKEVNDVDAVHEAAVMTRREEIIKERRSRLTENKTYKLGIDTKALSGQVDEKVMQEAEERAQDAAYDELRLNVDKHLMFVDQQRDAFLRARQEDINDFRLTMQRKEDRREWDLNNPHALQNDAPARRSDDDPNLSVSGLQKFAGEDLQIAQRTKQQQAQLRAWADAQAREKAEKDANEKLTDALWANHMLEADLLRTSYAEKEAEILRQRQKEFAEYNLAQAELKKQLRVETDAQAEMDNAVEIQNQLNSAWLTEDPAITRSFVQPHRPRPDHYKGMSPEDIQAINEERARQVQERKRLEQEEKDLNDSIDDMQSQWNRLAQQQEHEVEMRRAALRKQLLEEHKAQAEASKAHYSHLYNEVYTNEVTDDFYKRFGTSAR